MTTPLIYCSLILHVLPNVLKVNLDRVADSCLDTVCCSGCFTEVETQKSVTLGIYSFLTLGLSELRQTWNTVSSARSSWEWWQFEENEVLLGRALVAEVTHILLKVPTNNKTNSILVSWSWPHSQMQCPLQRPNQGGWERGQWPRMQLSTQGQQALYLLSPAPLYVVC